MTSTVNYDSLTKIKGFVGELCISVLIDSGSSISLVSEEVVLECCLPIQTSENVFVQMASKDRMILSSSIELL